MTPREGGPSPEEMDINPEEMQPSPKQGPQESENQHTEEKPHQPASSEMTEKEKEAKREIERAVVLGLKELHDSLQTEPAIMEGKSPGKERLEELVNQSGILAGMEPVPRNSLIGKLHTDKEFRTAGLPQFTEMGKGILDLWIHSKGLGLSADRELEELSQRPAA